MTRLSVTAFFIKTVALASTVLLTTSFHGQHKDTSKEFEGIITYRVIVKSQTKEKRNAWQKEYGTMIKFYYKNGNYRMEMNGNVTKTVIFKANTNTEYYIKMWGIIDSVECSSEKVTLKNIDDKATDKRILRRKVRLLEETFSDGAIHQYYYDPTIFINPIYWEKHHKAFLDTTFAISKSIFLKYTFQTYDYTLTYKAKNIKFTTLNDSLFDYKKK